MRRTASLSLLVLVLVVLAAAVMAVTARDSRQGRPKSPQERRAAVVALLAHGVNVSRWQPQQDGTTTLSDGRLAYLRDRGVTFLRLPVDPRMLLFDGDLTRPDEAGERALAATVTRATALGLGVSVTLRADGDVTRSWTDDPVTAQRLGAYWERLARLLEPAAADPQLLVLAPMNEPLTDAGSWAPVQADLLAAIRRGAPSSVLLATTSPYSFPGDLLSQLEPLPDPEVVYAVHLYAPEPFVYQQVFFRPDQPWLTQLTGLPYPVRQPACDQAAARVTDPTGRAATEQYCADGWGADKVEAEVETIARWGRENDRVVVVEEFGVWQGAPAEDRLRLLSDLRLGMERRGLGWSVWAYDDAFGLGSQDSELVWGALGLRPAPPYEGP